MLHAYRFSNFQSFRDPAEVSFKLGDRAASRGFERRDRSGQRLNTVMAVMGANGAGKTAALKPLAFAHWFASESFASKPDEPIPVLPHLAHADEPTSIEIDLEDDDGVAWRYALECSPTRVVRESLHRREAKFRYVFERTWLEAKMAYHIKQQDFGMPAREAARVRPNASLISTGAQYGIPIAQHLASLTLTHNLNWRGRNFFSPPSLQTAAALFASHDQLRQRMVALLRRWDLGLDDIGVRALDVPRPDGTFEKTWLVEGRHKTRDGGAFSLLFDLESSGTQSAFILLARLLPVLEHGGVALIDELDNDLHPGMIDPILDLFASPTTNSHGAQLIFSCHTLGVLDTLRKAQVLFVEKLECESTIFRGDEIEGLRTEDNLRAKYASGALGAVPRVN